MKISEIMNGDIEFAAPGDSVQALAELMGDLDVGALPVGTPEAPLGVVTDRDVLYRVVARGLDPATTTAGQILSAPLISARPDDTVSDALDLMAASHVRRLGVVDGAGRLVGWVTLADLSRRLLLETEAVPRALAEISGGSAA
ncbi:CBS domain-containing protein [Antarcticirhabdus aurantiaca]|uniref:CBS domain-containing protein n=1 Tax=Antarcticirhabdus aurantiaca TaxID=2606717 RepID=A0ACD4NJJ3_9HYPH|nr:CBS domain-containing protein [Antarcticirhabdus aurantiaca]WAJ26927.1 CBS domain-containing protein [Jeongeuplla avenae]